MVEDPNEETSTAETGSQQASRARDTDTSVSDITSSTASTAYSIPRLTSFNGDSEESKVLLLKGMFSELKEFDIKHSLKKANGDFQTALDDLLNIQYLKSTGQEQKGVDGFFQPETSGSKKRKNRKKGKKPSVDDTPPSSSGTSTPGDLKEMKRKQLVPLSCLEIVTHDRNRPG